MVILGDIIEQIRGLTYSKKDVVSKSIEGYNPVLRAGNIQLGQIIEDNYVYVPNNLIKEKQFLKEGDMLIAASSGSLSIVGKAAMVNSNMDATFGAFCKVLRPKQEHVYKGYFKHYFETSYYKRTIKSLAEGANINNLRTGHFDNLEIPLPPLDQQKKIAAILDAADAYRQKTKALIEKYDELTQSLFLDMFGDPVSNPKKLPTKTLGELCEFYSGRAWKKAELGAHGYKLVRISNLHKPSFPYWHFEGEMLEKHKVEAGDLLFSWAGVQASIDSYIYKGETAMINQHIYNIKPRNEISKLYLYHLLQLHLGNLRGSLGGGVGQFHLKKSDVTGIKVILPNDSEMANYIASLSSINKQKKQAKASLLQAEDLFNSLLQRAFKGELTT